ncbi:hypothetical protein [Nitrosopumilus ureiphilus]|uniref:Uncharacterized protein n=1 Tax=Nitrosopumilus ureiphilus TaxID=1470067 RepID=A0A7D5R7U9_9ARCH|nr:hypothetical protein [Nitrosopumilus ureiphilus]QLH07418.1 hypothetical protein C5F50_10320 [Nitrosopumilus ureiphilus]
MAVIEKQAYRCDRCSHEWYPRLQTEELPAICPKCKSAYWNKPRRIDLAKNEVEQARASMMLKKKRRSHDEV